VNEMENPYRSGESGRVAREADLHGRCDEGCDHFRRKCDQVEAAKATAIEVPSSHVAMLSFPKEVAELIITSAD
jgi:hypothetical protein